jgi:hypothetical protein
MKNRPIRHVIAALALVISTVAMSYPIEAKPRDARPATFSAEEERVIARNEALTALVKKNPQAVRRVLDLIENAHVRKTEGLEVGSSAGDGKRGPVAKLNKSFDPKANPDLEQLLGSSPEASHDLFQLLKRAGVKRGPSVPVK